MNGQEVVIVVACAIYGVVYFAMRYCRENHIENPVLTARLWWSERKERE